jgi:L-ascorbate metabolism protein UlaG (beta-lactamase superfamily)
MKYSFEVGTFLFILSLVACAHESVSLPSDHFDGERFFNEDRTAQVERGFGDVLKWLFTNSRKSWPDQVDDNLKPDFSKPLTSGEAAITHINHATEFIQVQNLNVLTDPVFSKRVSPFSWIGPSRHRAPGAGFAAIPKIDVVLISHNHYDHLGLESLKKIERRDHPIFIVPLGNKKYLKEIGAANIVELDWWQAYEVDKSKISLVPMQHFSRRTFTDRCECLWGGFVLEASGVKVLFAGDTGYNSQFSRIREHFGSIDVSILPIGAYEPRWFMKPLHMNPEEAVRAHIDLKSSLSIGNHFGTFQVADEGLEEPVIELRKSLASSGISQDRFLAPKNGQTIFYKRNRTTQ